MNHEALKVPPHSIPAEQSVLGGLVLEGDAWDRIQGRIAEGDFYRRDHRLIFRALAELAEQGKPLDALTVGQWLENAGLLDEIGGMGYLGDLARNTPNAANIVAYADIVRDKAVRRGLIAAGRRLEELANSADETPTVIDQAESLMLTIGQAGAQRGTGLQPAGALVGDVLTALDERYSRGGAISGLATGFRDLDRKTTGLHPGQLIIVAGRPSMGKTAFAMNIVEHVAIREQAPVAVFSMEMPSKDLIERSTASQARADYQRIRDGKPQDSEWPRITQASSAIAAAPLFIDDTPALTPGELSSRARRLKREHGLAMIVVDYLQLMTADVRSKKIENRNYEITQISQRLKALAKDLQVPVVVLSQLNRGLESRLDKRPQMSDLRESGAIEQDADVILMLYRDEVYDEDSKRRGIAEAIIRKQRNGPIGKVYLTFHGELMRFEDYAGDIPAEAPPATRRFKGGFDYSQAVDD